MKDLLELSDAEFVERAKRPIDAAGESMDKVQEA